ncbi:hypothetical protein AKJ57_04460 [candidate division MSBL1 archaeon SCGC-AAA259A05]|uniref:Dihydrolipoyl dehydrogenase n=1 Tax=candidate division MSBL1 archaeon SCGC-AAA259A05 TaxID=1698259 RepID=A0A133U7C1_9EURY|nr:hypothetical protein AKJ57_04460 [candidate division MSBL1 archaeon SCGC-AAA259A05]
MDSKDLLVIGGGPAGLVAAIRAAEMGLDVTLAEKGELGGVCLNRGCIPSKSLATASDLAYYPRNSSKMGIKVDLEVDYEEIVSWSDSNIDRIVSGVNRMLDRADVDLKKAEASFISSNEAEISGEKLEFDKAIIATGSIPEGIPDIRVDHDRVINSEDFFDLTSLPEKIVVLGAGYVGMELGTICAKLGSDVTIVEMLDQILPNFSKRVVTPVARKGSKIGLDIQLGLKVTEVEIGDGVIVRAEDENSEERTFYGDRCLVSVGRVPTTEGLELGNTDVELDEKGFVETCENFRTEDSNIYAVGDVVGGKMLAHEAYNDSVVAVDDILGGDSENSVIPEVVFTDPQIAKVGGFKEEYDIGRTSFRAVGAAHTKGKAEGVVQLAVDGEGVIRGGRIVGPYASEIIHEVAIAVENGLKARDVVRTVHAHPTISEGIMRAAEDAMDLPSSGF